MAYYQCARANPYNSDNPRVEGSGNANAGNIQWVGSFGGGVTINLKPEDTKVSLTCNMTMTIFIDEVSQGTLNGTQEYTLSGNSTFRAENWSNTSGNKSLDYSYKVW